MIASLADAWGWYQGARELSLAVQTLGGKHWDALPWEGELGRDNRLRHLEGDQLVEWSKAVLADLDDLCVLLLFSVFEAAVRDHVLEGIESDLPLLRHPTVRHAVGAAQEAIEHGSFFRVLEPFKETDADLVEQVNQVRRYRNWVAHGRRGKPQGAIDPGTAYDRLQRFLDLLNRAPAPR